MEDKIKSISIGLFDKLGITYNEINIIKQEENIYLIKIDTEESSLFIGSHGRNLKAIESIIKLIVSKLDENRIRLHLEVNDYIHSKNEELKKYVISKVELAKKINKDIRLNEINPYERKKAHGFVSELNDDNIFTQSRGEGKERRLFICIKDNTINTPKQEEKIQTNKLSIDLDGDNI